MGKTLNESNLRLDAVRKWHVYVDKLAARSVPDRVIVCYTVETLTLQS